MNKAPEKHQILNIRSHWVGLVLLVPFLVMLLLHRLLGFSDALMIQTPLGEKEARMFNLLMVIVFYAGVALFVVHSLATASRAKWWLVAKSGALAMYWGMILKFA